MNNDFIRVALIGYGYWGINIARSILSLPNMKLVSVSDINSERIKMAQNNHADINVYDSYLDQIESDSLDAVIVATPVSTHFEVVKKCLEKDLHVLSEKVLSENKEEIIYLKNIAEKNKKILDVGLTYLHNNIVRYIHEEIKNNSLGEILYITLKRTGLGPIRKDVDVITDLAAHDISILLKWFGKPDWVSSEVIQDYMTGNPDICFIQMGFDNIIATIHCSWLTPIKQRLIEVVGKSGMIIFDDIGVEKLKIIKPQKEYYKEVLDFGSAQLKISSGDIIIPNIDYSQPLLNELEAFYDLILNQQSSSMPDISISIAEILIAIRQSIAHKSARIVLNK